MVNFFKGTKDRASFFLSPRSGHHTKSRMIQLNFQGWKLFGKLIGDTLCHRGSSQKAL